MEQSDTIERLQEKVSGFGRLERHFGRGQAQLERMKELCKERDNLYEKQNDLKGQKQKIEATRAISN